MKIQPTVGRVVHYYEFAGASPWAAIICHVWSNNMVNLTVFDPNGFAHSKTSVWLVQPDQVKPESNYCEWMPYQKGQAAKTEQLEKELEKTGVSDMSLNEQVLLEVQRATAKFPTWPTDPIHALAVLGEEYGELQKAVLQAVYEPHKSDIGDVRKEAIQTAAMALRFVMSLERYEYQRCRQHKQIAQESAEA